MTLAVKTPSTYSRTVSRAGGGVNSVYNGFLAALDSTGRLYVHGGVGSGSAYTTSTKSLERYDPSSDTWSTLASSAQFVTGTSYLVDGSDRLIYSTGIVEGPSAFTQTDRGEIYDPSTNTWANITQIDSNLGRTDEDRRHALFWVDGSGHLNILGGGAGSTGTSQDGSPSAAPIDLLVYSGGAGGTWTRTAGFTNWASTNPLRRRIAPTQETLRDASGNPWQLFGSCEDGATLTCTYLNLSTSTRVVTSALTSGQTRGFGSTAGVFDPGGILYIAGGTNFTTYHATTWKYNVGTDTWTQLANMPRGLAWGQMVYFGGYIYYIGGEDASNRYTQILRYDPTADTWTDNTDNLSVARAVPAVVPTLAGTAFWIYGGNTAGISTAAVSGFTNVLELWTPAVPTVVAAQRGFAAVIGD